MSSQIPFELNLLTNAKRYNRWIIDTVTPYLGQQIFEVGAGIGNLSRSLPVREKLIVSEGSAYLFEILKTTLEKNFNFNPKVIPLFVDLDKDWKQQLIGQEIDTIVSFNVLEHVLDDQKAIHDFYTILKSSPSKNKKRIVTYVPAHSWAYGSIDQGFGHYRRYSHNDFYKHLKALNISGKTHYEYINMIGLPGWFLMGRILKKKELGLGAVNSFEKICPFVRPLDWFLHKVLRLPFGQSLLFVLELD